MPIIRGRYYANPAYGEAMERARDAETESGEHEAGHGAVHHIHIVRHADGVRVHVHHHGPGSYDEHDAPSGHWSTRNFDHDDHEGVGRFVTSVLAKGHGTPTGRAPLARS
ncbi:MAG TPA: hypothetical protein VHM88_23305 [Candidatus Acidoferrales bacterium]|nr:hypothetical protein [Candidatus Acidoferrales bacterium]